MTEEKKPIYKKKWFIALAVLIVLSTLSLILNLTDSPYANKEETEELVQEELEETELDPSLLTTSERINYYAEEVFEDNFLNTEIISSDNKEASQVIIYTKFSDSTLTGKSGVRSFLYKAGELLEKLQGEDFDYIAFGVGAEFIDKYGNTKPELAVRMELPKSEVDKINFESYDWGNLPKIATVFKVHPSIDYEVK